MSRAFLRKSFVGGLVYLVHVSALGMGAKLPEQVKNVSLSNTSVVQPFALRATDGSIVEFTGKSPVPVGSDFLDILPAEKKSKKNLCRSEKESVDVLLAQSDMMIELTQIYIQTNSNPSLTSEQKKFIQTVPRCNPFLVTLRSIAANLSGQSQQYIFDSSLIDFSLVKAQSKTSLQFSTSKGKTVEFQIANSNKAMTSVQDITTLVIQPQSSGQGIGIQFNLIDYDDGEWKSSPGQWVACTKHNTFTQCNSQGKCDTMTQISYGNQWQQSNIKSVRTVFGIVLYGQSGNRLYQGQFTDYEFESDDQSGPCL
ncbi:MAG: hypothetical protein ACK5WZ_08410 [Pseudobdellovibrionaceae bacterium]